MDTFRIYKEEELLKTANGEYIVEAYKCRRVGDTIIGLCVNSSPMFCRAQKNVPKGDYSWIEVLKPTSSILEHDNTEERYNTICPKVVWGIAAYLLFHSYTDTKGRTLFKINQDVVQPSDLFRYYNEQNKKHYATLNKEDFDYYKSIDDTTSFDKEFIEHHIAQEESLINRQNTSIPDYIKEKAKEYIEWIKINYIKNEQCLKEKKNTPSPYSLEIIPNLKEEEKEEQTPINISELKSCFKVAFINAKVGDKEKGDKYETYFEMLIGDLQKKRTMIDYARIALIIHESKKINATIVPKSFKQWYEKFCKITNCKFNENYNKRCKLIGKEFNDLKERLYYL